MGAGAVGGLVGGVGMGVLFHAGANAMPLVGALYGWPTVLGGWLAHLSHSLLFGAVFAVVATRPVARDVTDTVAGSAGL